MRARCCPRREPLRPSLQRLPRPPPPPRLPRHPPRPTNPTIADPNTDTPDTATARAPPSALRAGHSDDHGSRAFCGKAGTAGKASEAGAAGKADTRSDCRTQHPPHPPRRRRLPLHHRRPAVAETPASCDPAVEQPCQDIGPHAQAQARLIDRPAPARTTRAPPNPSQEMQASPTCATYAVGPPRLSRRRRRRRHCAAVEPPGRCTPRAAPRAAPPAAHTHAHAHVCVHTCTRVRLKLLVPRRARPLSAGAPKLSSQNKR